MGGVFPNLANPYNKEPKAHSSGAPQWLPDESRYLLTDSATFTFPLRNYLDFDSKELVRSVSVFLDFRVIQSDKGDIDIPIATLQSNRIFGVFLNQKLKTLKVKYQTAPGTWCGEQETLKLKRALPQQDNVLLLTYTWIVGNRWHHSITANIGTQNFNWSFDCKKIAGGVNFLVSRKNPYLFSHSSPENWKLTFGGQLGKNRLQLNRILLFKGMVEYHKLGLNQDEFSSENRNTKCTEELVGANHMVCLACLDSVHVLTFEKIACLSAKQSAGMKLGPEKGGSINPKMRVYCPEGNTYLPDTTGICQACSNPDCKSCEPEAAN